MAASFPGLLDTARYTLLASAILVPGMQSALAQPFPYQQWVCAQGPQGWQCKQQAATPGAYPQPPRPPAPPGSSDAAAAPPGNAWDYVPASALSEAQACKLGPGCRGGYVEPALAETSASDTLRASADRTTLRGNAAQLAGDVELQQGNLQLRADSAELDRASQTASLRGHVVLRQPGELVRGEAAVLNTRTQLGHVEDALYLNYTSGARATAKRLNREDEQLLTLDEASFTQCTPDDETWLLSAKRIEIDNANGWGAAKHSVLRVANVPVFYLPYATFPIDDRRMTGLLWPSFANDSQNGLDVAVPFYWNIAPNADATLTPRYIDARGTMLETEVRHLSGWGTWNLSGAYLGDDELTDENRWLAGVQHSGRIGTYGYSSVDIARASDGDYFRDLDTTSLEVRRATHLVQQGQVGYADDGWRVELEVLRYQTLNEELDNAYQRMPRLVFERREQGANFRPEWLWLSELTVFDHADAIADGGSFVTGTRAYAEPGVSFPMRSAWGYVVPTAKLRHVAYDLDDALPGQPNNPSTTAPLVSLDSGLIFERDAGSFVQTLEPRLFYVYSDYAADQSEQPLFDTSSLSFNYSQLFRDRRFTGYDRLEDFDQATVGLTSRFIDRASGRETFSASLGQIFYFDQRRVSLQTTPSEAQGWSNSAIAAQLDWRPTRTLWASSNALWESRHDRMQEAGVALHYAPAARSIFNFGYRYRRANPNQNALTDDLRQSDLSFALPLGDRFHLVGRWNYDLDEHRSLEELVGIEYDACCWRYRLAFQRAVEDSELNTQGKQELQRDNRVLLEFQLKGLGNIGDRIGSILEESIFGYRDN